MFEEELRIHDMYEKRMEGYIGRSLESLKEEYPDAEVIFINKKNRFPVEMEVIEEPGMMNLFFENDKCVDGIFFPNSVNDINFSLFPPQDEDEDDEDDEEDEGE